MILLPCCCGCHESPPPVDEWENITKVMDWAYAPDPDGIAPYPRPWYELGVGGACLLASSPPESCGVTPSPTTGDEAKVCFDVGYDRIIPPYFGITTGIMECTGGTGESVGGAYDNCYRKTGNQVRFDEQCKKVGWKGVASKAEWPGRFGFVNSGAACCTDGGQDQTKYRTMRVVEKYSFSQITEEKDFCDGVTPDTTTTNLTEIISTQDCSVDAHGNLTRTGSIKIRVFSQVGASVITDITDSCDLSLLLPVLPHVPLDATCGVIQVGSPNAGSLIAEYTNTATALNALNINPPTASYSDPGDVLVQGGGFAAVFECSDTILGVKYRDDWVRTQTQDCSGMSWQERITTTLVTYDQKIELDAPHSYGEVAQDNVDMLDNWPLNDDAVYPWRTDSQTWLLPLVSRDAGSTAPSISWAVDADCKFIDSPHVYTGELRGLPLAPGMGYHFDFNHVVWQAAPNPPFCGYCEKERGAWAESPLPKTATQWVNNFEGADMFGPGGHVRVGYMQKWAETLEEWPRINFSRPCGPDRYARDEEAVACVVSFVHPDLETDGAFEFEVGDVIGIEGDEVYQVTGKTDAANYTLGAKLYDSPVPYDDGVAKLRWPAARSVCSTLPASCVQSSPGVITVTTNGKHWLRPNSASGSEDTITFTGIGGLTTAVATVVSEEVFTVPGTLTTPTGGTISHGASAEQITFHETCSRHEFIARVWQSQYRTAFEDPGEPSEVLTETAQTLTPTTRHPSVLWTSPNSGDTFPHGYQIPFGSISADQCYDEQWHANFLQAEPDIFWQTPHAPCGGGSWSMVDQPCDAVDSEHYAWPPLCEPRLTLPAGAPALAAGVSLHTEASMPTKVGHSGTCSVEPNARGTYHGIRAAWLVCEDWKEATQHKC